MARARICVITGDPSLPDPTKPGQRYNPEDLESHAAMRAAFGTLAHYDSAFFDRHDDFIDRFRSDKPDLVVNFCDTGFRNIAAHELHVPAYLELMGIPCTGASPQAMVTCYDKQIVRLVAEHMGVPVPREGYVAAADLRTALPDFYPALIKPNQADGSLGITKDSVVHDDAAARRYLDWLADALPGRDVLVQEYLPGPEYGIGLIGNPEHGLEAFPPLEVDFAGLPAGLAPILSYESKSLPDSPYWTEIRFKRATASEATVARMAADARRLFARFGLRDYGRFDFRVAADGEAKLMEINPNPAWANDGKLCFMAGFAGVDYPGMLDRIVKAALRRVGRA